MDLPVLNATPKSLTHAWTHLYPLQQRQSTEEVDDLNSLDTATSTDISASTSSEHTLSGLPET